MAVKGIDISVIGDKKLVRAFNRLHPIVQRKVFKQSVREAGNIVKRDAKARAPKDKGLMARGITIRAIKRSRFMVGVLVSTPVREKLGLPGDGKWYYPSHVELGTPHRAATPFMRPALKENEQRVKAKLISGLRQRLGLAVAEARR